MLNKPFVKRGTLLNLEENMSEIKTVLVCYTQATFDQLTPGPNEVESEAEQGEEEAQARRVAQTANDLTAALKAAGLTAEIARVPQRSFAPRDVAKAAFGWRLLDVTESNGVKIDLVVCLDFPAWSVGHPNKVCWLLSLPNFVMRRRGGSPPATGPGNEQAQTVASLLQAERRGLSEAKRLLAGSREIAQELARSGLQIEYNPWPATPPDSPEWQAAIQRLLGRNYGR